MVLCNSLLVKDMRVGNTVDPLDACEARVVAVLVSVSGIERICGTSGLACEFPSEHNAELCRMFRTADSVACILIKLFIDLGDTTGLCAGASAAADESVDIFGVISAGAQHIHYHIISEIKLIVYVRKL